MAPDIVIVDWEMPGLDGAGFVRMVRSPGNLPVPGYSDHHADRPRRALARGRGGFGRRQRIPAQAGVLEVVAGPSRGGAHQAAADGADRQLLRAGAAQYGHHPRRYRRGNRQSGAGELSLRTSGARSVPTALIAIDQGTTSTRAIVFDAALRPLASAQQELRQIYPAPGLVEHDPEEIWAATVATVREAMAKAGLAASDVAGIGITNQRETTVIWDRATGKPIHNAIVWQDRRTAGLATTCAAKATSRASPPRPGCCSIRIFPRPRSPGCSSTSMARGRRRRRGELAFGTIDSFLLWRLTGGRVHATDATNAARTLLLDIGSGQWDEGLCRLFGVPPSHAAAGAGLRRRFRHHRAGPVRRGDPHSWDGRRPAGGDHRAGLLRARHDEVDLRHRLLCAAQYRRRSASPRTTGCSRPSPISSTASAPMRWKARSSLPAPRCNGCATASSSSPPPPTSARWRRAPIRPKQLYLVPAFVGLGAPYWDAQARGAIFGLSRNSGAAEFARAALEAVGYQTRDLLEAMHADWPQARGAETVLRVDGGMTASDATMQFLADILASPVDRPVVMETTALGAAYLAGRAAGLCPDLDGFAAQWRLERRFLPAHG